jgi:hypothetical protein
MTEREFLSQFLHFKQEFLATSKRPAGKPRGIRKNVLDNFERWLQLRAKIEKTDTTFNDFLNNVILVAGKILEKNGVTISCPIPVFKESKRCISIFKNSTVFYRIGRVKPRRGFNKGQNILAIELVMDGHKKSVFLPLLEMKEEIEERLGEKLLRELPRTESAGHYRVKTFLPYQLVESNDVQTVARALADFILATLPSLEKLGLSRKS